MNEAYFFSNLALRDVYGSGACGGVRGVCVMVPVVVFMVSVRCLWCLHGGGVHGGGGSGGGQMGWPGREVARREPWVIGWNGLGVGRWMADAPADGEVRN